MEETMAMPRNRMPILPIVIFIVLSLVITVGGIIVYISQKSDIEQSWEEQLSSLAELKSAQIENWKNERINGIKSLSSDPSFINDIRQFNSRPKDKLIIERLSDLLTKLCGDNYFGASLIDCDFREILSRQIPENYIRENCQDILTQVKTERKILISDIHEHELEGKPHFDLVAPVIDRNEIIAYLLVRVDPERFLSSVVISWPIRSKSAEILFAERKGDKIIFMNRLKHYLNSGERLEIPMSDTNILAVKGLLGFEGVTMGYDYRGKQVIGAVRRIASGNWVVVIKVDRDEIYGAIFMKALTIFSFILLIIAVSGMVMLVYWKNQKILQAKEVSEFLRDKQIAEQKLLESEFKFGSLFSSMNEGVALHRVIYDGDGKAIDYILEDINPAFEHHTGILVRDAKGKPGSVLYGTENPPYLDIFSEVAKTGLSKAFETFFAPMDKHFIISVTSPGPGLFATIFSDITERKKSEFELLSRQERLNALYALSHMENDDEDAILEYAANMVMKTSESESCMICPVDEKMNFPEMKWFGKAAESGELVRQYSQMIKANPQLLHSIKTGKRTINNAHTGEAALSTNLPIMRSLQVVVKAHKKVLLLVCLFNKDTDYTIEDSRHIELFFNECWNLIQKKRSDKELLESQNRFRTLANATFEGIIIIENGMFIDLNAQMLKMTGYTREALLHKNVIDFVAPKYRDLFREITRSDMADPYEYEVIKADGTLMPIEVRTRKHAVGSRTLYISSVRDMTKIRADQAVLQESIKQLELSNKELEQFAYVASHDLQEPLRMVSSFTQLLAKKYKGKLGADADEYISYAVGGASRMQVLINDLLDYSRVTRRGNPFAEVSLSLILGKAIINLKNKIDGTHAVITNDELPEVRGDETQLLRVFQNLIENALKYKGETLPHVHISAVPVEHGWKISVSDNGIGIPDEYKERIFEIFERLHSNDKYPGTGIGLSICKKIVERHGGQIWVESNEDQGVTFYFTILEKVV